MTIHSLPATPILQHNSVCAFIYCWNLGFTRKCRLHKRTNIKSKPHLRLQIINATEWCEARLGGAGSGGTLEQFSVFALVLILHVMLIFMTGGHLLLCLIITKQDPNLKRKKNINCPIVSQVHVLVLKMTLFSDKLRLIWVWQKCLISWLWRVTSGEAMLKVRVIVSVT